MSNQEPEAYLMVRQRKKQEGGAYQDIRVRDGLVQVLNSEHYYSDGDDWMGVMQLSPELTLVNRFGYGHNHSPWKKMAYKFDDITHDDDKEAERARLVELAAKTFGVTETAVRANPYTFIYGLRDRFDEEYKKEVAGKNGILVKPVGFDAIDGKTFIVDLDQSTVYLYQDGDFVGRLGDPGVAPGQFLYPTDVKIQDGEVHILDFPKNPGEYFEDKPCMARVQRCGIDGAYLGETILEDVRLRPSEWGQTSLEVTPSHIFVSNNHDLYVRDRDGRFISDMHVEKSRITSLRANNGTLGIGFYEFGGILFLETETGVAKGFLETKHPKWRHKANPAAFDFEGNRIHVALDDLIQVYEVDHHALPAAFEDMVAGRR
jgi:hypothetical protein